MSGLLLAKEILYENGDVLNADRSNSDYACPLLIWVAR